MMTYVLSLLFFLSFGSHANSNNSLKCMGIVYTETEVLDESFNLPITGAAHGGTEYTIKGKENEVYFSADTKWLSISWLKNGKPIALVTSVIETPVAFSRVLLVQNPSNEEEQVSINCNL